MKDAADKGHQQDDEGEERQNRIGRDREGEGVDVGAHQIFHGGKDQALENGCGAAARLVALPVRNRPVGSVGMGG